MLWRRGRAPFDLNLVVYESVESARAGARRRGLEQPGLRRRDSVRCAPLCRPLIQISSAIGGSASGPDARRRSPPHLANPECGGHVREHTTGGGRSVLPVRSPSFSLAARVPLRRRRVLRTGGGAAGRTVARLGPLRRGPTVARTFDLAQQMATVPHLAIMFSMTRVRIPSSGGGPDTVWGNWKWSPPSNTCGLTTNDPTTCGADSQRNVSASKRRPLAGIYSAQRQERRELAPHRSPSFPTCAAPATTAPSWTPWWCNSPRWS